MILCNRRALEKAQINKTEGIKRRIRDGEYEIVTRPVLRLVR